MSRIPIGLQLYSIRQDCANDLPGTLEAVAKMGYDGVDFAGYYGRSAKELRQMLDDLGIKCCGTHIKLDTLLGDELPRTVEFNQILGNKYLIVPGLPKERTATRAAWVGTAQLFNQIGAQLKPYGMLTGYHNHFFEFQPLEGELPWVTFGKNTNAQVVLQLDTGNAIHGGGDPAAMLRMFPGRSITVHLKEHSKSYDTALIGEGDTNWPEVFALCESIGKTEWYIVEQENYALPAMQCVDRCLQNLRKMGK